MADEKYVLDENPIYKDDDIRKLQNTDKANAESIFNPLFLRILNNIKALFKLTSNKADKVEGKGLSTNDYTTGDKDALGELSSPLVTNIYISNSGSDSTGDGTQAKPYQTVGFVLNMLESSKYNGAEVKIYLKAGETFELNISRIYELRNVTFINLRSTLSFSTRATLNVNITGAYRITATTADFTDLNINLSQTQATAYTSLLNTFFCSIVRCTITSTNNTTFALCGDALCKLQISLLNSQINGKVKLVGTTGVAMAGIMLLRVSSTTFGADTSITDAAKTLSQLVKVGDWYTTGGSILTPMTYTCWPYHPDAAQIKSGGVNDITFASKLFIYNLANAPTGNSTYGWLETDYVESGGFAPSPYGNLIQTFKYFYDPSVIYTRRATKSSSGVWTWENWLCLTPTNHNHDDRYYTEAEINSKVNAKMNTSGGNFTGNVTVTSKQVYHTGNITVSTTTPSSYLGVDIIHFKY